MESLYNFIHSLFVSINHSMFDIIKEHIVFFFIIVASVVGKIKESSKKSLFSVWIVYLFGTFFHELSHFIMSLITNGKPSWFTIFPSRQKDTLGRTVGYTLGYVESRNIRWYNVFFISLAPFLLIPLSFYVYLHFFEYFNESIYSYVLYVFCIVSLLFSSIPSGVDFKLFFSNTSILKNSNGKITRDTTNVMFNFFPLLVIFVLLYLKG